MIDENITPFDIMNDAALRWFFEEWLVPIIFSIALWYIINKVRKIDKAGQRRENAAKLTEIGVESIAHALSSAPPPIGEHFKIEYLKKRNELMEKEKFLDSNGGV